MASIKVSKFLDLLSSITLPSAKTRKIGIIQMSCFLHSTIAYRTHWSSHLPPCVLILCRQPPTKHDLPYVSSKVLDHMVLNFSSSSARGKQSFHQKSSHSNPGRTAGNIHLTTPQFLHFFNSTIPMSVCPYIYLDADTCESLVLKGLLPQWARFTLTLEKVLNYIKNTLHLKKEKKINFQITLYNQRS